MREYSFADVLRLTGVGRSQLVTWTDKGIIIPGITNTTGTGHHRRFSFRNLYEVAVAAQLSAHGRIPLARIKMIVDLVSRNTLSEAEARHMRKVLNLGGWLKDFALNGENTALYVDASQHFPIDETKSLMKELAQASKPTLGGFVVRTYAILTELQWRTGDTLTDWTSSRSF
jgi:DNA-binding transcriptional MerR regulator